MTTERAIALASNLVAEFEGCRLESYQDLGGIWTVGYGDTENVEPDMSISQDEADERLARRLAEFGEGVGKLVRIDLTDNQSAALISFAYNVGLGNLKSSTLLKLVNAEAFGDVPAQFLRWNKVDGVPVAGLTRRRQAEADLWSSNA